jgi:hypothetical protein
MLLGSGHDSGEGEIHRTTVIGSQNIILCNKIIRISYNYVRKLILSKSQIPAYLIKAYIWKMKVFREGLTFSSCFSVCSIVPVWPRCRLTSINKLCVALLKKMIPDTGNH